MTARIWNKSVEPNKLGLEIRQLRAAIRGTGSQSLNRVVKFASLEVVGEGAKPPKAVNKALAVRDAIRVYLDDANEQTAQAVMDSLKLDGDIPAAQFDLTMRTFLRNSPSGMFLLRQYDRQRVAYAAALEIAEKLQKGA